MWLYLQTLLRFPWHTTAKTLFERFREDRLGLTAGSLTFTTTMSLVPIVTVGLAVFSAFPMFGRLQSGLQKWLIDSLVPDNIARPVLTYLNQFAGKASQIGWTGAIVLLLTALALVLTIDRKLNDIWRVRRPRPLAQRVLMYWAVLTLGPLLLGGSLSLGSYALSASKGLVSALPGGLRVVLDMLEFGLIGLGLTLLYRFVPHTHVQWRHALVGGGFVAIGIEISKTVLAWYVTKVPTYSAVYGTFATVPILLLWIYVLWVLVLLGAVITAYLPSLLAGVARQGGTPGWSFQLALEVLSTLHQRQQSSTPGLSLDDLAAQLQVHDLHLEEPLETLQKLDWIGCLDEDQARYVLLITPSRQALAPLALALLLPQDTPASAALWQASQLQNLTLDQVLPAQTVPLQT
jgi:membrane protein